MKKNIKLKKQFFSFLGIKNPEILKNEKNEKLNEIILKIKKSVESLESEKGTLVLVTAQPSLNDVISLIKVFIDMYLICVYCMKYMYVYIYKYLYINMYSYIYAYMYEYIFIYIDVF
jgi:hypothetical protein